MSKVYPAPGLGLAGSAVWVAVMGRWTLEIDERHILYRTCKIADLIDDLDALLAEQGLVVHGSTGQLKINDAVGTLKDLTRTFAFLLKQLGLPRELGDDERGLDLKRSDAGRKLVELRYRGGK